MIGASHKGSRDAWLETCVRASWRGVSTSLHGSQSRPNPHPNMTQQVGWGPLYRAWSHTAVRSIADVHQACLSDALSPNLWRKKQPNFS